MVKLSLPLDDRPWAKHLALSVIVATILALTVFALVIGHSRRLDVAEITFIILVLLAVIPPNVVILRRPQT